jgi:hypothetical protein
MTFSLLSAIEGLHAQLGVPAFAPLKWQVAYDDIDLQTKSTDFLMKRT